MDSLVYKAVDTPFGLTYTQWISEWIKDVPGNSCDNQVNSVEFATLDSSSHVNFLISSTGMTCYRNVTIPSGTAILFPLVISIKTYPCPMEHEPDPEQSVEDFLKINAAKYIDNVKSLSITLDDMPYRKTYQYRFVTPSFEIFNNHMLGNCFDACILANQAQHAVADGYWIMLKPLEPGEHTLTFKAEVNGYGVVTDITYHIIVQ